jgi:hypothetical protein
MIEDIGSAGRILVSGSIYEHIKNQESFGQLDLPLRHY